MLPHIQALFTPERHLSSPALTVPLTFTLMLPGSLWKTLCSLGPGTPVRGPSMGHDPLQHVTHLAATVRVPPANAIPGSSPSLPIHSRPPTDDSSRRQSIRPQRPPDPQPLDRPPALYGRSDHHVVPS